MTNCEYHPGADVKEEEIRVTSKDGPTFIHSGSVCAECEEILSVGGRLREAND